MANKRKVIAIEIGHWFDPPDRRTNDGWWEFALNLSVGREIIDHLERHKIDVIVNSTSLETADVKALNNWTMEEFHNEFKAKYGESMNGVLKGIPITDVDGNKNLHRDVDGNVVTGFVSRLNKAIKDNEIKLTANISVHFNGSTGTAQGYESVFCYTDDAFLDQSKALSNSIRDEVKESVHSIRPDKDYGFKMCKTDCPTAYCEFGFYDNPQDRKYFDTEEKLKTYGKAAAKGIIEYLNSTGMDIKWRDADEDEIYATDHFITKKEYDKIPDKTLIIVHGDSDVTHWMNRYKGLRRIQNGNTYYKRGTAFEDGGGNFYMLNESHPAFKQSDKIPKSIAIEPFKNKHKHDDLYRIGNGNMYVKVGDKYKLGSKIYVLDDFPSFAEYDEIPGGSLILIHGRKGYGFGENLYRIQNGNLYYKI